VHLINLCCYSAGVGRTGTFIAIDTEIQHMQKQNVIDIYDCVRKMRFWRNHMVQTIVSLKQLIWQYKIHKYGNDFSLNTLLFIMLYWNTSPVEIPPFLLQLIMLKKKSMSYLHAILRQTRLDFSFSLRFVPNMISNLVFKCMCNFCIRNLQGIALKKVILCM